MGAKSLLAGALFPSVQQRLLALLFGDPDRNFRTAELIRLARGGTGGVHRLLTRLAEAGWVTVTPVGNQRHYRANRGCAAFGELRALVLKVLAAPAGSPRGAARRGAYGDDAQGSVPRARRREASRPSHPRSHRAEPARGVAPREEPAPSTPPPEPGDGWKAW